MANAQKYLNTNYPSEKRPEVIAISIKGKNLEGQLTIKDFPNLKKIECGGNKELTSIELDNLPELNYFHANNCQLTDIKVSNCPNITYFNIANNLLVDTKFLDGLNPEKLTVLSIHTNNFHKQNLSFVSKFIKLQQLFLDNCDEEKFEKGIFNKFIGSFKPLQDLTELEILSIGKTDIDSGLEYLPESFRKIGLTTSFQADITGCVKIRQELEAVTRIEKVTEKLKKEQENGDPA
ncbi:63_t:CDS:1 [Ambispora gerdemannii]|uniref:63_t:CDS:1 n=1 Tax=Ambispora gerdemannii TaxID=144530 RepID=A0A9N9CD81_9GLOM|nr:63_t:CDS:1 [Ambispora gerdemannii]